ncbi:MAG: hypothetical protein LBV67_02095 [Streptococcaceae bacterium]|nr:hypothetical protein [Streptococcaceae bacterium]
MKELNTEKVSIGENVNYWFPKAEFDWEYLVFSQGDNKGSKKNQNIVSINMKKGTIEKTNTSNYAFTAAGVSDNYFYTFQATTQDGGLYGFDKKGREVLSYLFEKSTTPSTQFLGKNQKLYLSATQEVNELYEHKLFIFEEKKDKLKEIKQMNLDDNPEYIYGLTSLELINDDLYLPITALRNRQTFESISDNRVMKVNVNTGQKEFLQLSQPYPNLINKSRLEKYLIITHEPNMLLKSGLSIVDLSTNLSTFLDISKILNSTEYEESNIWSINTTKDDKLLILAGRYFLIYDLEKNELLAKEKIKKEEEDFLYIWVNS